MKTITITLKKILLLLFVVVMACNNELIEEPVNDTIQKEALKIESKYKLLDYKSNVYHSYFKQTDNVVGFSSLKPNSLKQHSIVQHVRFSETSKHLQLKINSENIVKFSNSNKITSAKSNTIYGKTISFKVSAVNGYGIIGSEATEIKMYVPELVEITNPSVTNLAERSPLCDYSDFVLEWNTDLNNEEGLVVIAEYFGGNAIPEKSQDIHVLNTDYIAIDNGLTTLNTALFQDIPNLSYVDIVLLRGNVSIEEIEGEMYKFFAESHVRLPIILVKDPSTIVKLD